MKKRYLLLALLAFGNHAFAKPVNEQTAKQVGFNFLKGKVSNEVLRNAEDLRLVYTEKTDGTSPVNLYYVFNVNTSAFVMVAADDQVLPVFGYSTEGFYEVGNIPFTAQGMFDNYARQVRTVIEMNAPATDEITGRWNRLINDIPSTNKTTATNIPTLLLTKWNQSPYYNKMCPVDNNNGGGLSVTGCTATAMSQVMKYWNYPNNGTGNHSYYHNDLGVTLSADFASTTYNWAAMPATISWNTAVSAVDAIATLIYHAGVSVNMDYSAVSSGACTIPSCGPNNAQNSLKTYFGYSSGIHNIVRSNTSSFPTDQHWIDALKAEFDAWRVVLYTGYSDDAGHAWVADGYDAQDFIHMNWGWGGGGPDGFYEIGALNPPALGTGGGTGGGFNKWENAIIGITPPQAGTPDKYDLAAINNRDFAATVLTPDFSNGSTIEMDVTDANMHNSNDVDYYSITLPAGSSYKFIARLQDAKSSNNGKSYTLDARFSYKINTTWAANIDDAMTNTVNAGGGKTLVFRVEPVVSGSTGTYDLDITLTNTTTGVSEVVKADRIQVYPNPVSNTLHVAMNGVEVKHINIVDMQGRTVLSTVPANNNVADIALNNLATGLYMVQLVTDNGTITKKITKQ